MEYTIVQYIITRSSVLVRKMASISHLNQFPRKTLPVIQSRTQITSKPGIFAPNTVKVTQKPIDRPWICTGGFIQGKQNFRVRAAIDDEGGPDKKEGSTVAVVEKEEKLKPAEPTEIDRLKKVLVDSFSGTDRGLKATSETRAEIVELITQLEAKNPTPAPTEALTLLNGKWILAFVPIVSRGTLPFLKVEEISQTIDSETRTVQNCVQFSGPLATTSISTNSKFDVRSPKLVQIKLEEGIIGTPKLTDSIEIPENVEVLGQKIDLTPFKGVINSVQETASSVAGTISSQSPVKFPIPNTNAESWLLTTYLDEEVRVSRGDDGSVFVLVKEGSSLLPP